MKQKMLDTCSMIHCDHMRGHSDRNIMSIRTDTNRFCKSSDLSNEASVESFFVLRLLKDLGYEDSEIHQRRSIQSLPIPRGRQSELYKPDFLLHLANRPRWLIEAKATSENIESFTYQCAGYALMVNRKYSDSPLRYYMLTNGFLTRVYIWDQEEAILSLRFSDCREGNTKFETLSRLLGAEEVRKGWANDETERGGGHHLDRPNMDVVKKIFHGAIESSGKQRR